jgi:hypothetical protein
MGRITGGEMLVFLISAAALGPFQIDSLADQEQEIRNLIALNKNALAKIGADIASYEALQERARNGVVSSKAEKPIVIQPKGFPVLYKTEAIKQRDIDDRKDKIEQLQKTKNAIMTGSSYFGPEIFYQGKTKVGGLGFIRNNKVILVNELEANWRSLAQISYTDRLGREANMYVVFQGLHKFNKRGQVIPCDDLMEFLGFTMVDFTRENPVGEKVLVKSKDVPEITTAFGALDKLSMAVSGKKIVRPDRQEEPNLDEPIDKFLPKDNEKKDK